MCGFFYVFSRNKSLPRRVCQEIAMEFIAPRGPSHRIEFISSREYICQSVLSIQTLAGAPANQGQLGSSRFILYNGEIYNFQKDLQGDSDTEKLFYSFLHGSLEDTLAECDGMYALAALSCKVDERTCKVYRDSVGEKHVYYLFNNQYFAVSSTPGALVVLSRNLGVFRYDDSLLFDYLDRRHLIAPEITLFKDIRQIPAGGHIAFDSGKWSCNEVKPEKNLCEKYFDSELYHILDRMSFAEYTEALEAELLTCLNSMQAICLDKDTILTVSGGIDSSLVAALLGSSRDNCFPTVSCLFGEKDTIAISAPILSRQIGFKFHHEVSINLESYLSSLKRCIRILGAPVHSHSLPSSRILAQNVACLGKKVLYGGEGADELFLGYETYNHIFFNRQIPYELQSAYTAPVRNVSLGGSDFNSEFNETLKSVLRSSVDILIASGLSVNDAIVKANAMLDYSYQLPMVGLAASDTVISDCGIEARTPFTRPSIIKFGFSSPHKHLVIKQRSRKRIMKGGLDILFQKYTGTVPGIKSGFSGFPNETAVLLGEIHDWKVFEKYPFMKNIFGKTREIDWKIINTEWFLREWELS